ncbi:MAG: M20 family metallopeptidase [Bacillota bacterium]
MDFNETAKTIHKDIINWRRDLHRTPEIGFDLDQTSAYLRERLDEMGISYSLAAKTGIVGLIEGENPGPTLALRADMDALPIAEETGLSFASTNGNMHACGHDAHMAMLLGTAQMLNGLRSQLSGNVKLLFQPGEEGHGGAEQMIADGCLENPRVDAAVGLHVGQIFPEVKTGQIGIREGTILAAATKFAVDVMGKSTHGALPHLGVDSITTAAEMIQALQKIVSRETDPLKPAVLTVGKIEGGESFNIVTPHVNFKGDFRTLEEEQRQFVSKRLVELCQSLAEANRAEAEVTFLGGYPPTVNKQEVVSKIIGSAEKVIGAENIIEINKPNMGTEDMSYYLEKVPGAFFVLGTGNQEKGITYPHHNSRFDLDEEVLWIGPAIFTRLAYEYLT